MGWKRSVTDWLPPGSRVAEEGVALKGELLPSVIVLACCALMVKGRRKGHVLVSVTWRSAVSPLWEGRARAVGAGRFKAPGHEDVGI